MPAERPDDMTPPRPIACLRIGVTGHRPGPKLSPEQAAVVRDTVDRLLGELARLTRSTVEADDWAFASPKPVLSVVSSVAEGADRIVAEAGLASDMPLNVILPFARAEYGKDFTGAVAQKSYDGLLSRAQTVFELNGERESQDRAYEAAGLLMLANADIVIAVWDQMQAAGIGGTALVVERAVAEGVPVVLIDPRKPEEPWLLWRADLVLPTARAGLEDIPRRPLTDLLEHVVRIMVAPPPEPAQRHFLKWFLAEHPRRWNPGIAYPLLLAAVGVRKLRWTDLRPQDHRADVAYQWGDYLNDAAKRAGIAAIVTDTIVRAYSIIDHISTAYGQIYRSAYVFNYAASALAVLLALSSLLLPASFKPFLLSGEIVLIVSILVVLRQGGRKEWHRRWLEYRRLAETLRHLRILALVSAAARIDRPGAQAGRLHDWVSWYGRAVEREIPLPSVAVDPAYLAAVRDAVRNAEIKSQIVYNHRNSHTMEKVGERLHRTGTFLFWATLAICVSSLVLWVWQPEVVHALLYWIVMLTALFPTLGAAINAVKTQGDFESVARRANETAINLEQLDAAMERESLEFARLVDRLEKCVDVMMADNAEWHVLFRTRPLSLPA